MCLAIWFNLNASFCFNYIYVYRLMIKQKPTLKYKLKTFCFTLLTNSNFIFEQTHFHISPSPNTPHTTAATYPSISDLDFTVIIPSSALPLPRHHIIILSPPLPPPSFLCHHHLRLFPTPSPIFFRQSLSIS